jgi:hypothetical protein
VRRSQLYKYTSPGERVLTVLGKFLDATVQQMPNRRRVESGEHLPACHPHCRPSCLELIGIL